MNERIKELLSQAISDVDYIHFDEAIDNELAQMYIPDIFAQRFAELIIKECVGILKADGDHWEELSQKPGHGQELYSGHMLYAAYRLKEDAVWSIQEHFDIEPSPLDYSNGN